MLPRTTLGLIVAALSAFGLAAAACGGDGGTLTIEEYFERIAEIDAEYAELSGEIETEFDERTQDVEDDEVVPILVEGLDETYDAFEDLGNDLDDLNPPDEVEAAHDEAVESIQGAVDAYREVRDDFAAAEDMLELIDLFLGEEFDTAQQRSIDACLALEMLSEELDHPVDLDCDE